jgi:tetratricopeptide (TPR) repeat protein
VAHIVATMSQLFACFGQTAGINYLHFYSTKDPAPEMCSRPQLLVLLTLLVSGPVFQGDALLAVPRHAQEATDYASHFNHGGELIQQMRFHDAVAEFREALRLKPDYLPAHQALAVGYAMTQCFDLSWREVSFVRKAGAEMPERFADALAEEISEKDAADKREKNVRELLSAQKIAAVEPKKAAAHALLSHAFARTGDFSAAQKEADLALRPSEQRRLALRHCVGYLCSESAKGAHLRPEGSGGHQRSKIRRSGHPWRVLVREWPLR